MAFAVSLWWVRIVLLVVALAVTVHILKIRTCKATSCRTDMREVRAVLAEKAMIQEVINQQ